MCLEEQDYPDQKWGVPIWQLKMPIPTRPPDEKVSYAIRCEMDGEVHPTEGDAQPEFKDSTERVQGLAEEPMESDKQPEKPHNAHIVGSAIPFPMNNFDSMFEVVLGSMMRLSEHAQQGRPMFECGLCRTMQG